MTSPYEDDPGVRLMLAYQGGEEAAFDQLVELYSGQVYALLTRFLGQRSGREDLVQEVFLRVVRARAGYEPRARFSTWLYRIAFNLCVNETQRAAPKDHLSLDVQERDSAGGGRAAAAEVADPRQAPPSEGLERDDVVRVVRAAIQSLPETQRMALVLAKYQEVPYVEIAEVLGSSEKAVKSLIHRARENLREILAPYMQQELS